jgi:hypothetical protein
VPSQPIQNLWLTMLNAAGVKGPDGAEVTKLGTVGTRALSLT